MNIRFEKQVSEDREKVKTKVRSLDMGKTFKNYCFLMHDPDIGDNFFLVTANGCTKQSSLSW